MRSLKTIKDNFLGYWVSADNQTWEGMSYLCVGVSSETIFLYYNNEIHVYNSLKLKFSKCTYKGIRGDVGASKDFFPGNNLEEMISRLSLIYPNVEWL